MTDKECVIDLNTIPNANVLRFNSIGSEIDFCNNSTHILILFPNTIKAVHNIYAEKYILESKQGNCKVFDLPMNTDKKEAVVFISSSTNVDLDKIQITHIVTT